MRSLLCRDTANIKTYMNKNKFSELFKKKLNFFMIYGEQVEREWQKILRTPLTSEKLTSIDDRNNFFFFSNYTVKNRNKTFSNNQTQHDFDARKNGDFFLPNNRSTTPALSFPNHTSKLFTIGKQLRNFLNSKLLCLKQEMQFKSIFRGFDEKICKTVSYPQNLKQKRTL